MRERPELNKMPVLMLSSSVQPLDVKRAAQMDAQGFIKKHPTEQQVREIVAQVSDAAHQGHAVGRIESSANLIRGAGHP